MGTLCLHKTSVVLSVGKVVDGITVLKLSVTELTYTLRPGLVYNYFCVVRFEAEIAHFCGGLGILPYFD